MTADQLLSGQSHFDHPHLSDLYVLSQSIKTEESYATGMYDGMAKSPSQITSHYVFKEKHIIFSQWSGHAFSAVISHFSWIQGS